MSPADSYLALCEQEKRMSAVAGALSVLHWDRAVMMPPGGAEMRGEQIAALRLILHEMRVQPARAELIADAESGAASLDPRQRANLLEISRAFLRATALPGRLVEALSLACTDTEMTWREARRNDNFALVAPKLENLLTLVREQAAIIGAALELDPYDALLDAYEPGLEQAAIAPVFDRLAEELPALLEAVLARQEQSGAPVALEGPYPVAAQEKLGRELMSRLGFDFNHGRLDVSEHPFTAGVPDDSRITTRYDDSDFIQSLMAVIHETGHSLYERGLPREWRGQPAGRSRGMMLHESQSLLFEMQAGRSPAYLGFLSGLVRETFGVSGPGWTPENLLKHYHRVSRGLIRVYADEVSYPLHIVLRTRLERAMLAGDLKVTDLPGAWREGMGALIGITPSDDRSGCLQDIHWYSGSFGYFPTYTLGALAAAQLYRAALAAHPEIEAELGEGRADRLLAWLRQNVHAQASFAGSNEILRQATGEELSAEPFFAHLRQRYLDG